ncbi:MAG TPA: ankyrin repeat domain-containing protein [Candidatus Ozemobacteraceae bacterium]|nr:ankyrin repeat domain-containing protein [Candidatus Ozemobacteraceae bacterium]
MWTKLTQAIERCDVEAVRLFLSQEPESALLRNYQDETLLHFAAGVGSLEIVDELMRLGAQPDLPDEFGWTPIHEACAHGHAEIVARFIDVKANIEGISKKHETALHLAVRNGFVEIVKLLLDAGANREARNDSGETPLHLAARDGNQAVMKLLLEGKADVNARSLAGETPLHMAARDGDIEVAELCLGFGANPKEEDKRGNNFLELAVRAGKRRFLEHFAGLELKSPEQPGATPAPDGEVRSTTVMPAVEISAPAGEGQKAAASTPKPIRSSIIMKVKDVVADVMDPRRGMFNAFVLGSPKPNGWLIFDILDSLLWYIVFPIQVFIIWMAFHQKIIPGLISFSGSGQADSVMLLVQTGVNTLIVFVAASLLVETDTGSVPLHHYPQHLRDNVRMRVIQLAVIEIFFVQRLTFDQVFWDTFFPFWAGFIILYGFSFICWWAETGGRSHAPKPRHTTQHRTV